MKTTSWPNGRIRAEADETQAPVVPGVGPDRLGNVLGSDGPRFQASLRVFILTAIAQFGVRFNSGLVPTLPMLVERARS
jgi:hypothetical protein